MKSFLIALGIVVALFAAPALAVSGGKLGTLERGAWACEMPGDAGAAPGVATPQADFAITNDSTYLVPDGRGTYLRTGKDVRMTSGPRDGEHYIVQSEHFLRKLDAGGKDTGLRCIKLGEAGSLTARPAGNCKNAKKEQARTSEDAEDRLALACGAASTASS
ncbi:MAG TPA: hypothetical protein VF418_02275 [Sphingomonadaceae bacterium]